MTTLGQWSRLLDDRVTTPLPDAGLGPMTDATRAGNPNAFAWSGPTPEDRPRSATAPIEETLSLPIGAYGAGQLAASGAMHLADSKVGQGLAELGAGVAGMTVPGAKMGAFIPLAAMKRLHDAGLRPRNLPKGLATEKSYNDFKRIMPYDPDQRGLSGPVAQGWIRDNWDNTGWVGRGAWGSSPAKEHGLRTTEPVAWVPFSDMRINPSIKEYEGPLSGALQGDDVKALFTAEPRLADLPAKISTVYDKSPRGSIVRDADTFMPSRIELYGGNYGQSTRLGHHELQHAFDAFDQPGLIPSRVDGILPGTQAGRAAEDFFAEARQVADMLGLPDSAVQQADSAVHSINKHAFYLQSPWEQIARETARREAHGMSPRTLPGTYGGADPWAPNAMMPSWNPSWWDAANIDTSMFRWNR